MRILSLVLTLFLVCQSKNSKLLVAASPLNTAATPNNNSKNTPIFDLFRRFLPKKGLIEQQEEGMGQAVRVMKYDRAANVANAIPVLDLLGSPLRWHRLDDGVMGGRSETLHTIEQGEDGAGAGLHFTGTINTDGGGFTSVRAPIEALSKETTGIKLKLRGDGKTYKLLLSSGKSSGSPFSRAPSWQVDIPTEKKEFCDGDAAFQETTISFDTLKPSFGPRSPSKEEASKYKFDPTEMTEIGIMLSLLLSDGSPNPKETFGEGIFPFSLFVKLIEPITVSPSESN
mmetsp:Transcript_41470/g.60830  ORF Transcript_41470/g.60830 Transcript_41470/m.60830 type:complete len:285 (-) Transcript_41470:542-1396(-)